jgi:hypothetical protein
LLRLPQTRIERVGAVLVRAGRRLLGEPEPVRRRPRTRLA